MRYELENIRHTFWLLKLFHPDFFKGIQKRLNNQ